jgi:hypothetical protein
MSIRHAVLTVLAASALVAGCGGEDVPTPVLSPPAEVPEQPSAGALGKTELAAAADANCGYLNERLAELGPRGKSLAGIKAESAGSLPALEAVQALQQGLTAGPRVADDWRAYLEAGQSYIDATGAMAEATDQAELNEAAQARAVSLSESYPPADELGLRVCSFTPKPVVEPTEMRNAASFELPEPTNTVEQATRRFLGAVESGDCGRINAQNHSDNATLDAGNCKFLADQYAGTDLVGSQSYGPIAFAELYEPETGRNGTVRFVIDTDGRLRYAGQGTVWGGGARPPTQGFAAQQNMDDALAAIRDGDGQAFFDLAGPDSVLTEAPDPFDSLGDSPSGTDAFNAISEDAGTEAVMLTANRLDAVFVFDGEDARYLLTNSHDPGSEASYSSLGYWLLP